MSFLTDKDNEEIALYTALSKSEQKKYLKKNNMIIVGESKEEGSNDIILNIEFDNSFHKKLMVFKLESETEQECLSRLLKESINKFDVKSDVVKKPKNANKKSSKA